MPEHDSELSLVDKHEGEMGTASEETAGFDSAAPEAATVPSAGPPEEPPVSRAEYEQLKAERDHLIEDAVALPGEQGRAVVAFDEAAHGGRRAVDVGGEL